MKVKTIFLIFDNFSIKYQIIIIYKVCMQFKQVILLLANFNVYED